MKEAFDIFWKKSLKAKEAGDWVLLHHVLRDDEEINNGVYIPGTKSKDGWADWLPKLQSEPVDFEKIDSWFSLARRAPIHQQMKEYVSTYWFMNLEGFLDEIAEASEANDDDDDDERYTLYLDAVEPRKSVLSIFESYIHQYNNRKSFQAYDGFTYLLQFGTFLEIGDAQGGIYGGLYFNNDTGEVICVDWDWVYSDFKKPLEEVSYKVASSLEELIKKLEPR
ncbi:MAG: hypothetical protein LBV41_13560 [Cytophagaceae bacterium]|jgi:hypothetical protein|nr:hypothetical protein [Cytophagaceae bacterium]